MTRASFDRLEKAANLAWPSLRTAEFDNWICRSSFGYTRRSNSILPPPTRPLGDLKLSIQRVLSYCAENEYAARFKIVSFLNYAEEITGILVSEGFQEEAPAHVMSAVLSSEMPSADRPLQSQRRGRPNPEWLHAFTEWNQISPEDRGPMRALLEVVPQPRAFLTCADPPAAVGLGVAVQKDIGLFDLVVDPRQRRKGFGRAVVAQLLEWGRAQGCEYAFLQVLRENEAAISLYKEFGFAHVYDYSYYSQPVGRAENSLKHQQGEVQ